MFHDDGCALLIGINDYSLFDRSLGQAEGTSDLRGSVLDAHLFWRMCIELGMSPRNIRVLASPRPDLSLFPGASEENVGEATEAGVRAALSWLSGSLSAGRAGLLTYSGHGAHTDAQGLLLCPSDTEGPGFERAVPFRSLREALGEGAKNLTVVLDCCHGGREPVDARGRRPTTLAGDSPRGDVEGEMRIGARVLSACRPGQLTQQAVFGGAPHGAFTWALAAVVEQWKAVDERGNVRLDLSYGTLVDRAQKLLALLDFSGTPALFGPPGVESLAVMQLGSRGDETSASPDRPRKPAQIDPGQKGFRYYTFLDGTRQVAGVLVPRTPGTIGRVSYDPTYEYWFDVVTRTPGSLTVQWLDYDWTDSNLPTLGTRSFTMVRLPTWVPPDRGEPPTGADVFASDPSWASPVVLRWELSFSGGRWSGQLKWFDTTGESNVFAGAMPPRGLSMTKNPSYPIGLTWFKTTVTPVL